MAASRSTRIAVELDAGGEIIPAILQRPAATKAVPGVLALHGFNSRKERMSDSIGRALLLRGVACLAVDLPLHGARDGSIEGLSLQNPLALVQKWRQTLREANHAVEYLAGHPSIDAGRIGIAGYSLGSYIAVMVAAANSLIRAVALAAGGDLPEATPLASLVRSFADPKRAVRRLAGRPLLMVNGTLDRTIRPVQARSLFAAAGEPKELRWYQGGHWPPHGVIEEAADWLAEQLMGRAAQSRPA